MTMKVREVLRVLFKDGWYIHRSSGSHRQLRHPTKKGTVTVAGKPSQDMPPGTLRSIEHQADIDLGER